MVPQDTMPAPPAPQTGRYGVVRAAGVGLTALVVGVGLLASAPEMVRHVEEVDVTWPEGTTAIEVVGGAGDVVVREDGDVAPSISLRKSWSFREPAVDRTTSPEGVTRVALSCPAGPMMRCHGDFSVVVPTGMDVTVRSSTGDVELAGVTGDVRVTSNVGDLRLDGAPPTADLRSSVGTVTAVLTKPPSLLRVESNVGDINLTLPRDEAYAVRSQSDISEVRTTVTEDSRSDYVVDVRTNVGTIRIDDD